MSHYPASLWIRAVRAYSFTASITPVVLGTALAYDQAGSIDLALFLAALAGGVSLHIGTNLVNDYYDYLNGVDRPGALGGSGVLVEQRMQPRDIARGAAIAFAVAVLAGIYLTLVRGWVVVALGMVGLVGGYFYTAGPIAYKYRALGEFLVFALMGPLMVLGAHFVQIGQLQLRPLVVSLPIGILVAAILFANNVRDLEDDDTSGYQTQAGLLGRRWAPVAFGLMLASAYLSLPILVLFGQAPAWILLALASLPVAWQVTRRIFSSRDRERTRLVGVVEKTAQLHLAFGVLLTAGFVLERIWR